MVVMMAVFLLMFLSTSITIYEVVESRPEVGSSSIKIFGLLIISKPIESRLRSPPEHR